MAQVNAPEKLDPQDIVKLLMALRRAVKVPPQGVATPWTQCGERACPRSTAQQPQNRQPWSS
ncbi:hypothetical protein [Pseudomonas sp. MWU13-2100]|uniref:hypothetical protein n=1 Tax=Pseudomonas sp. MWU13-2100 TaxID=2935075 RepID=UPI00200F44F3|nr:hypothetical protein [Pseudomonas sp. MWU13-2100]